MNINKGTNTQVRTSCTSKYMHRHRHKSLIWDLILVILDHVIGFTPVMDKKKSHEINIKKVFHGHFVTNNTLFVITTDLLLRKQF